MRPHSEKKVESVVSMLCALSEIPEGKTPSAQEFLERSVKRGSLPKNHTEKDRILFAVRVILDGMEIEKISMRDFFLILLGLMRTGSVRLGDGIAWDNTP